MRTVKVKIKDNAQARSSVSDAVKWATSRGTVQLRPISLA